MTPSNKRQRTSLSLPTTVNDLTSDLWCVSADLISSKTFRALLAVAIRHLGMESWRKSGWKGQPSAGSKAIISSTARRVLGEMRDSSVVSMINRR
eukprot:scaffold25004_cov144-Skeletonema_dohrnii-CCMP3373.AAC.3